MAVTPPVELQAREIVLIGCRRHWVRRWPQLAFQLVVALVVPVVAAWVVSLMTDLDGITGTIVLVAGLVWAAYWGVKAALGFYQWRHDVWVVTNQRILDSYRKHWFDHQLSSADLVDVEDMSVSKSGMLSTMMNFGDVRCQTAGVETKFVLADVPEPARVLGIIDSARDAARRELRGVN